MDSGRAASNTPGKRKRDRNDDDEEILSQAAAGSAGPPDLDDGVDDDSENEEYSEDECSDDDDESIMGPCEYDESTEPLPSCAAFDKDFTQVGQDLMSIPARVVEIVDSNGCESRRAQSCRDNADDLARIPKPSREKIALLGNTGAGNVS